MEARFSARPDRPWGPPSLLYNGYRVFPGGKVRPGRAADHSLPSSAEVLEEYSYISIPLWATTGPVTGLLYFLQVSSTQISLLFREYRVFFHWGINWEEREADHSSPYTGQVSNKYRKAFTACIRAICLNTFVGYCVDGNVATVTVVGYWLKKKNGQYQQIAELNP